MSPSSVSDTGTHDRHHSSAAVLPPPRVASRIFMKSSSKPSPGAPRAENHGALPASLRSSASAPVLPSLSAHLEPGKRAALNFASACLSQYVFYANQTARVVMTTRSNVPSTISPVAAAGGASPLAPRARSRFQRVATRRGILVLCASRDCAEPD